MSTRQQLILKQLGIQQWISRGQSTVQANQDRLWRDQYPEQNAQKQNHVDKTPVPLADQSTHALKTAAIEDQNQTKKVLSLKTSIEHRQPDDQPHNDVNLNTADTTHTEILDTDLEQHALAQQISFEYDILIHEHFILFAEVETQSDRQLLQNIQKACFAESFQLKWPLNLTFWDTVDHLASAYLQGFFAVHSTKKLITLGDLQVTKFDDFVLQYETCPTLKQMQQQPELKKVLWSVLYPLVYEI